MKSVKPEKTSAATSDTKPALEKYRAKRSADRTPEPFGGDVEAKAPPAPSSEGHLFCVQKHAARRLHYDFRLELGGVLLSWAVPKGPSYDVNEKRLAMEVEDHPVEYADFEGIIPEGNYGAGAVIVWDRGLWVPLEDPEEGMKQGKLVFELRGYKLRGIWHLFRLKSKGRGEASKEWMLVKKTDSWAGAKGTALATQESIYSGLTLEELRDGHKHAEEIRSDLTRLGAPRRKVAVEKAGLMLAETRDKPFTAKDWIFELKYDGYRILAARDGGSARLIFRHGSDASATFPEISRAVSGLPYDGVIVDGEVVVLDDDARPSFQRLQRRALLKRTTDIARATVDLPATLFVFDLLAFEDFDLRGLKAVDRKAVLKKVLPKAGPLRYTDHVEEQGEAFYDAVGRMGLEGIMAKKADSTYRAGRSAHWLKLRVDRADDFVVAGYTKGEGSRIGFGALHVAAYDGGTLVYCGRVGSGFDDTQLRAVRQELEDHQRATPPCEGNMPKGKDHTWVEPRLVCEVRYKEYTGEGNLRQPVFLRFRDDKTPEECIKHDGQSHSEIEAEAAPGADDLDESPPPPPTVIVEKKIGYSNLDKVFWPEEKYTKGDLIEFYRRVSPWLLPYLKDRPLVLTRYPDGIHGKSFFQKDAPGFVPGWVRTERMWSEHAQREIDYFIADDEETLLYLANLGTIPLHVWSSRVQNLPHPDWCILDLDPKGAPFTDVIAVALAIRDLAEEIDLRTFVKTSGATGIHILVPLNQQLTYEQSKSLGEVMARVIVGRLPKIATITRTVGAREGKVYVDFLQNGHGKTIAGPFSVRPLPAATVSTPMAWSEVTQKLDPKAFTIRTVPMRMEKAKDDPLLPILAGDGDLLAALARLSTLLQS